jgi:hypothetical protein
LFLTYFGIVIFSERAKVEAEEYERRRLEDMSEDEYDALEEELKATVDRKRLEIKKERLRRYKYLTSSHQ